MQNRGARRKGINTNSRFHFIVKLITSRIAFCIMKKTPLFYKLSIFLTLLIHVAGKTWGAESKFDLIIKDGLVIDGTGSVGIKEDVGIQGGKIVKLGDLSSDKAEKIISAKDRIVCPGFVDVHTHVDYNIDKNPTCENFVQMGVTTVIAGNCGTSPYPLGQWFEKIEKLGVSLNVASLVGHNTARNMGMGIKTLLKREPKPDELKKMCEVVEEGMKSGAVGFSSGLVYLPGMYAKTDEIIELAKVAGKYHRPYVTHMRNEGNEVLDSIEEALKIGREANCPVQISHFKINSKKRWGHSSESIGLVEEARKKGQDVMVDQYMYTASSTRLLVLFPQSLTEKGLEDAQKKLEDPAIRAQAVRDLIDKAHESGFDDLSYAYVANFESRPEFNGKNLSQIAQILWKKNSVEDQAEAAIELLKKQNCPSIFHTMSDQDLESFLVQPFTMVASDASTKAEGNDVPHPRGFGNNPRALAKYVREKKLLKIEECVHKMSGMPAERFHLKDRGLLMEGKPADIVIFDPETIDDRATYETPRQFPVGIDYVFVNGTVVVDHGKHTGAKPGQIIRAQS